MNFFIFPSYQIVLVANNGPCFANPSSRPPYGRLFGGLPHEDAYISYLWNRKALSYLTAKGRCLP